jgi:hypothetical protein
MNSQLDYAERFDIARRLERINATASNGWKGKPEANTFSNTQFPLVCVAEYPLEMQLFEHKKENGSIDG